MSRSSKRNAMTDARSRAVELLGRMTMHEKVAQLTSLIPTMLFDANGIRPEVAQTLVNIEANLSNLTTCGTLQAGIAYALARRGQKAL